MCSRACLGQDGIDRFVVNKAYAEAIRAAGGTLIMLTHPLGESDLATLFDDVDGILIPGGTDVDPELYHESLKKYAGTPDPERDATEIMMLAEAQKRKLPILAICRGFQMLNVYTGGSLYQDLKIERPESANHDFHEGFPRTHLAHPVSVENGTILKEMVGADTVEVNSLHHQGINVLGKGLIVSAKSPDGLVEGIELENYPFCVGVQWHPEELATNEPWSTLFRKFIESCGQ